MMKLVASALIALSSVTGNANASQPLCGGGIVGSGLCADPSLCCSLYGYCGNSADHCNPLTCWSGPSCGRRGVPCGSGVVGTGVCDDPSFCCSQWGYCGNTATHCDPPACWSGPDCPQQGAPCGGGNVGIGICEDSSLCCSEHGWCGTTSAHCDAATCYSSPENTCAREAAVSIQGAATTVTSPPSSPPTHPPTSLPTFPPTQPPTTKNTNHPTSPPTSPPTQTPTPAPTDDALEDEIVTSASELLITIDNHTQEVLDSLTVDPSNTSLVDELRNMAIYDWSSNEGLELAMMLEEEDTTNPTYVQLRSKAEEVLLVICQQIESANTEFSQEVKDCACTITELPAVYCAATADRELLDILTAPAGDIRRRLSKDKNPDQRELAPTCEVVKPGVNEDDSFIGALDLYTIFKQATQGDEICISAQCSVPLPPPASFLALQFEGGGCIPGLDTQAMQICQSGTCNSIDDVFQDFSGTNLVNAVADPRVFFRVGVCLNTDQIARGPVREAVERVEAVVKFLGGNLCIANAEVGFHPLVGYLLFQGTVRFNIVVKLGVTIEAQFYDEVKDASGICSILDDGQCSGQGNGKNSCSLCADEHRGRVFFEASLGFLLKEKIDIIQFGDFCTNQCIDSCGNDRLGSITFLEGNRCTQGCKGGLSVPDIGDSVEGRDPLHNDEARSMSLVGPIKAGVRIEVADDPDAGDICNDDYASVLITKDIQAGEEICISTFEQNDSSGSYDISYFAFNGLDGKASRYSVTNFGTTDDVVTNRCTNDRGYVQFFEGNNCSQDHEGNIVIPGVGDVRQGRVPFSNDEARSMKLVGPIKAGARIEVADDPDLDDICDDDYTSVLVTRDIDLGEEFCIGTFERNHESEKYLVSHKHKNGLDGKVSQYSIMNFADPAGVVLNRCTGEIFEGYPSGPCGGDDFFDTLAEQLSGEFNSEIFLSQQPDPNLPPIPSTVYKFEDFLTALKKLQTAGSNFAFWYGDDDDECNIDSQKAALVNMAAFLGQAMRETIIYDACDENNWDKWRADVYQEPESPPDILPYLYPMSSGCGQLGQRYAEYRCDDECPQDLSMEIIGTTNAGWIGAPPPLFCGPKSKYDGLGYWNPHMLCQGPDNTCEGQPFFYSGQTAGVHIPPAEDGRFPEYFYSNPLPDANGNIPQPRTSNSFPSSNVEGCCWWGRGVIQTTGRCNFGKLNKYLGSGAGSNALYSDINFCQNPQAICEGPSDLKWVAGIFFWVSDPQRYDSDGFNYKDGVKQYVDMGCADNPDLDGCDFLFEYASGIVNRGCHDPGESGCPGCVLGATCDPAHNIPERVEASKRALRALMKFLNGDGDNDNINTNPSSATSPSPESEGGTCGDGSVGDGICSNSNDCCSQWGWCGTTSDHCGGGSNRNLLRRHDVVGFQNDTKVKAT